MTTLHEAVGEKMTLVIVCSDEEVDVAMEWAGEVFRLTGWTPRVMTWHREPADV